MKNGQISNKQAPFLMYDIDSLLFKDKHKSEKSILERVGDMFKTEERRMVEKEFDETFMRHLNRIWTSHNVCIGLVSFDINLDRDLLEDRLAEENLPYTRLYTFDSWEELRDFDALYKFSKNEDLISFLSQREAIHYSRAWEVLS